jgi:hypothetical protein
MQKTRLENLSAMAKAFFRQYQSLSHVGEILATHIFQFVAFEQILHALLRIEIRSIARKAFQVEPLGRTGSEKLFNHLRTMDWRAIPNDQDLASDLAQEYV